MRNGIFKFVQINMKHLLFLFACLIWFFTSHQQSFSYIGTVLPGLNQYWARINVSCSRTTTQWRRWGSNPRPFGLESSTQPLSHCAPETPLVHGIKFLIKFRSDLSLMPRSHIHGLDAGLATDTIRHHSRQSVLVRSFPYCIRNHT